MFVGCDIGVEVVCEVDGVDVLGGEVELIFIVDGWLVLDSVIVEEELLKFGWDVLFWEIDELLIIL